MFDDFGGVAVRKQSVGAKIFIHFDKVHFTLGLLAGPRGARFAITHNSPLAGNPPGFDQRPQSQDHRSRIASGIGPQSRPSKRITAYFGQAVDRFAEAVRLFRRLSS